MILSTNGNLWAIAGMVYALAGAALICNAVFLTPVPGKSAADDVHTLRRQCEQWLDYRIGAVLVAIGFFMQATGSFGSEAMKVPAAFVLLGLCFAAVYYGLMKGLLVEDLLVVGDKAYNEKPLTLVRAASPLASISAPVVVPLTAKDEEVQGVAG